MPLIVRELVIKATLAADGKKGAEASAPAPKKEKLIAECVAQVTEILTAREER